MADVVKYGVQISNRVFVGGVAFDTKEAELKDFFSQYGKVKECKIIKDNQSISRGFAFVTFECKHDAYTTQQLGTVFFNQKKLNLGPAIRQKGVVFNGATDYENEPVLSTGVYIHPNGLSYTVSPNAVWYYDSMEAPANGRVPGSPPMYSTTLVHKIQQQTTQEYQSVSPLSRIPVNHTTPGLMDCGSPASEVPYQATQITPNQNHHPFGYVHQNHPAVGSNNIHVAFQNMTLSSHPGPSVPGHHVQLASSQSAPSSVYPAHSAIQTINNTQAQSSLPQMQYGHAGEMFVPYPYYSHINHDGGSSLEAVPTHMKSSCHFQLPVQRQDNYSMVPNLVHDTHLYPLCDFYPPMMQPPPAFVSSSVSEKKPHGNVKTARGFKKREKVVGDSGSEKDTAVKVGAK